MPPVPAANPQSDWGGLPAAVTASKAGAINVQLSKAADAEAVLKLTDKNAEQLNSVNVATALHRIAGHLKRARSQRDKVLRDKRFTALLDATVERAPYLNPRSVSDLMWAFATLKDFPPIMVKPVLTQVMVHLEAKAFEAQHLALIVWAFAILGLKPVKVLERIEIAALGQLKYLNTQNCANMLWGMAKLGYQPQALLGPISAKMREAAFLSNMKPVEVTDSSFALAVLGTQKEQGTLMAALAQRAQPDTMLGQFSSRQLVMLTWAFARAKTRPSQLDLWIAEVRAAHERQPLLEKDQKNLAVALNYFDEDSAWLNPPKLEDGPSEEELAAAAAKLAEEAAAERRAEVMGRPRIDPDDM